MNDISQYVEHEQYVTASHVEMVTLLIWYSFLIGWDDSACLGHSSA
jgi:hypothetical protein